MDAHQILACAFIAAGVILGYLAGRRDARRRHDVCRFSCSRCGITWETPDMDSVTRVAKVHDCVRQTEHNQR